MLASFNLEVTLMASDWNVTKIGTCDQWIFGITSDNNGNLYYTTRSPGLCILNPSTGTSQFIQRDDEYSEFGSIVWDRGNNIFLCDYFNHKIMKYSLDSGKYSIFAGAMDNAEIKTYVILCPNYITMDSHGNLYITSAHRIQKIDIKSKTVKNIAGSSSSGHRDHKSVLAEFDQPDGIVVLKDGTILVADRLNQCIRKIDLHGFVSTISGSPHAITTYGDMKNARYDNPCALLLEHNEEILLVSDSMGIRQLDFVKKTVEAPEHLMLIVGITCLAKDKHGNLIAGTAKGMYKWEHIWTIRRLLWIAHLKEDTSYCHMAKVPRDIIKEIAQYVKVNPKKYKRRGFSRFQHI